ncbi:MAG: acetoacetate decarboxylase family protein [Thermodesulfobacteriota bacterium]
MGFVKTPEELDRYYRHGARTFTDAKILGILFETKQDIVTRLLPPPLLPASAPTGMIFIAEYPVTSLGPGYMEAALLIHCTYEGEQGSYCLSMPIASEESRLYNGRDIFGYPKKMAAIHLEKNNGAARGWVERHGIRFLEISAEMTDTISEMPALGANFLFKALPRIDLEPGFDGPVHLCRQKTDIDMKHLEIGTANLALTWSDADPWAELDNPTVIMAFYLVSDNTMQPGKVLTEVDGDAYLPYYFKMTDFYQG